MDPHRTSATCHSSDRHRTIHVKQHPGYWYVLATEFLHFGDDCPFADVLPERIPRTPSKPGKFLRECALGTHADMRPCDGSAHAFMDGTIWIIGHGGDAQHPIQPGEAHRVSGRPQPQPSVGGPKSARILPSHTASIAYHVSEERHSKSWVRSGMSENVRSHIGRIHHSLCWYKDRMQPSCGTSTSKQTSTAQNGLYVSCS